MLINILIRTSYRPSGFKRALQSVLNQTHKDIRIIVSYDNHNALRYIPDTVEKVKVLRGPGNYFYDDYCNKLKELVTDGYFLFLDDDDYLANPEILANLPLSEDYGLIVQLRRGNVIRPETSEILPGKIGMPCLILHHSHKHLANIPPTGQGDYYWIKAVSEKLPMRFEPVIVVCSDKRGNGKQERPSG
jgi:glycosyltransferase involved in cell wall biosynthesis